MRALVAAQSRAICFQACRYTAGCASRSKFAQVQSSFLSSDLRLARQMNWARAACCRSCSRIIARARRAVFYFHWRFLLQEQLQARSLSTGAPEALRRRVGPPSLSARIGHRCVAMGNGANGASLDTKLTALREKMAAADGGAGVVAYIIPSEDPHMASPLCRATGLSYGKGACMRHRTDHCGICFRPPRARYIRTDLASGCHRIAGTAPVHSPLLYQHARHKRRRDVMGGLSEMVMGGHRRRYQGRLASVVHAGMQSEYAPSHQERRRYISGFTGSAGTALVTTDEAHLWTDGRYWLQARVPPPWWSSGRRESSRCSTQDHGT